MLFFSTGMGAITSNRILRPGPRPRVAGWALLVLLASAACASPAYHRLRVADEQLSRNANASLRERLPATCRGVEARAYRGVVTLLGHAETREQHGLAERAVEGLPGVDRVNNLILLADFSAAAMSAPAEADSVAAARVQPAPAP